ncbi:MAG: hypothetical protein FJ264_14130 [Planctomycetes bacterium]|nr:hypothetical protein [Planctomycetota bacterium]
MNSKLIKLITVCLPILFIFGCSASQKQAVYDKTPFQTLEKRIDDLSKSVTLIINDTNVIHNKIDILAESQDTLERKIGKLEDGVTYLSKKLSDSATTGSYGSEHHHIFNETTGAKESCDGHDGHNHSASDRHIHDDTIRAVTRNIATGFWDALMANDLEAAKSFATSASGNNLKLYNNTDNSSSQITFGNITMNGDKTMIETILNTQKDGSQITIPLQTILIQENNQWKVDADQTMMSIFGGAMGELMEGLGEAMKNSMEGMGKAFTEDLPKINQ